MIKEKLLDIIDEIGSEHPYKISGVTETYSQYNEAWADCCDKISRKIEEYFNFADNKEQKYLVSYMYLDIYNAQGYAQEPITIIHEGITEKTIYDIISFLTEKYKYEQIVILSMIKLDD